MFNLSPEILTTVKSKKVPQRFVFQKAHDEEPPFPKTFIRFIDAFLIYLQQSQIWRLQIPILCRIND